MIFLLHIWCQQVDNEKLRSDLDNLRDHMTRSDESHHKKYRKLLRDMQNDIERYVPKDKYVSSEIILSVVMF